MAAIFLEHYIESAISGRLAWLKANKTVFNDLFNADSRLPVEKRAALWSQINESADPFFFKFGYPKEGERFPCVRCIHGGGRESQQYIGDTMNLAELEIQYGVMSEETYSIWILSSNPDECYQWHKLIKALLIYARGGHELKESDNILNLTFDYGEFNPSPEFGAWFTFARTINLHFQYQEIMPETTTENSDDIDIVPTMENTEPF